jgi:ParB family chromosome partitioning protein
MDPIDEADAFAVILSEGRTIEDIGRRFGVTCRHVEQRLALANLSPKLKAAWTRGDLTLDAARAFCLVADHARQDAVFRSLSKPVSNAASVRTRLMEGGMRASDRHAVFVGLDAYEAAGGKLVRDLFDADAVFIEDPALVMALADKALKAQAEAWKAKGWRWVEASLDGHPEQPLSPMRVHPEWREPTAKEQAELDRLEGELAVLDAELDASSVEDDPRWARRDDLEAAYESIRQAAREWNPALIALAGVMLTIGHDGEVLATEGLVRKDDHRKVEAVKRGTPGPVEEGDPSSPDGKSAAGLPRSVARDVTRARTEAIRASVARQPDLALALCVAALASRACEHTELAGIGLSIRPSAGDFLTDADDTTKRLLARHDILDAALSCDRRALRGALAVLIACAIDLTHEDATACDHEKQTVADAIAQALDLDMTQHWRADQDFWLRLPKTMLLGILAESPAVSGLAEKDRVSIMTAAAKLRKAALAARLNTAFAESAYLPELLITPLAKGQLALSDAGAAAVAAE